MELLQGIAQSGRFNFYSGAIFAMGYTFFATSHFFGFKISNDWTLLLFCLSEAIVVFFIIIRSYPKSVSLVPFDWFVGIAGTFTPMLLRPAAWGIIPAARYAIVVGMTIQLAGLISLNRSIALVAAKREIKTGGLYRFVRHPLYAAYVIMYSGYVLKNTTIANLIIYLATIVLLLIRIFREEEHLTQDIRYREYTQKVHYRIIPFVF